MDELSAVGRSAENEINRHGVPHGRSISRRDSTEPAKEQLRDRQCSASKDLEMGGTSQMRPAHKKRLAMGRET